MEVTAAQHRLHQLASVSLVALIVLCGLWELVLAPLRPGDRRRAVHGLVSLMEGVEDIPGVALTEGVTVCRTACNRPNQG